MTRTPVTKWPPEKIARFVSEWNSGVSSDGLRERFGRHPSQIAQVLRRRGYSLNTRPRRWSLSLAPKNRPEDLRAKWST